MTRSAQPPEEATSTTVIVVDVGNSAAKLASYRPSAFAGKRPLQAQAVATLTAEQMLSSDQLTWEFEGSAEWYIASVCPPTDELFSALIARARPGDSLRRLTHHDFPITTAVDAPELVGADRLAAAVAANVLRPTGRPAIVVDAGTAITVDVIDPSGVFLGGVIIPGSQISMDALAQNANQLPSMIDVLDDCKPPSTIGKNTCEAITSGVFWGGLGSWLAIVNRLQSELDHSAQVYLTGRAMRAWLPHVPCEYIHEPQLVLQGIATAAQRIRAGG